MQDSFLCILYLESNVQKLCITKIRGGNSGEESTCHFNVNFGKEGLALGPRLCIGELSWELRPGWFLPQ